MIDARGISKRFGTSHAIRDVSLAVHPGEVFCLLGANGAGKTTLLNICLGFVEPDVGSVTIAGQDVLTTPERARAAVGYVPEQVLLYGALSGVEHVQFFAALGGRAAGEADARAWLARVGLQPQAADRRVETYSKGMRQKVGLAIALAKDASTLLLDEPLSGLDPKAAIDLSTHLRGLALEGRAVLLTTHDMFRALETATHIGIMRDGRLHHVTGTAGLQYSQLEQLYLDTVSE